MSAFIDLTKQKFYRLTVVSRTKNNKSGRTQWKCQCSCGNIKTVASGDLISGNTKSCGCLNIELLVGRRLIHGMRKTPEYTAWCNMKNRCYDPTNKYFNDYGGRGIKIFHEWQNDFMAFFDHIGPKPTPKHTLERVDNSKGYFPGNIIWDSRQAQANNTRHNHHITIKGTTKNVTQWAKTIGVKPSLIYNRLWLGWNSQRAVLQPVRFRKPNK